MVEIVVKVGGALLAHSDDFAAVLETIDAAGRGRRLLVVPGGGPFADAVRDVDRRLELSGDAAHWMAVLAMDQYAHVIADRLPHGALVSDRRAIVTGLDAGHLPVLAPFRWLRDVDPLPHRWDVTSDSIAAWVAGELGARRLVLIKPPGAVPGAADLVDAHFARSIPSGLEVVIHAADQKDAVGRALQGD
jgi:aspartokinase-like uncharacterized kinase